MTGASGRQRVQTECFDDYLLAVPPHELLDEFQAKVGPMFDLIFSISDHNKMLKKSRDLLLPRLLSGDLDVADLNINTEASRR